MRYVSAYALAVLGGNDSPNVNDLKKILGSVGIDCEDEKAQIVIKALSGKSLDEVMEAGRSKLACVPSGGAVAVSAGGGGGGAATKEDSPAEAKKEEKKEESEDEDGDMGFGLFD